MVTLIQKILCSRYGRHVWLASLALFGLSLVVWAGLATWQCPGHANTSGYRIGSPVCPSLPSSLSGKSP